MTTRDELRDRLDELEARFNPADTSAVVVIGRATDEPFPDGVDPTDIMNQWTAPGIDDEPLTVDEPVIPIHRPPQYRGDVVVMSEQQIAQVFATMPDEIRRKEREARVEHGEPIPAVLQQ